ncbi:MAG: alanine racemase, partial [Burkholderiales bacterium]
MPAYPPAAVGMRLSDVDTPALVLELDPFERNLKRLHESLSGRAIHVRPHAKSHKCPQIALRQIALGAVGVCCQKVSEAEALVEGGVGDVLIANEVVGAPKLERLAALATQARVAACADDASNVRALDAAARRFGVKLDVLVEINVGANRCGVEPGEPALEIARAIVSSPNLRFAGLQAYQGAAQHLRKVEERRTAIEAAAGSVRHTRNLLQGADIACPKVTGAGTGTYVFEAASSVYDELQPGSYIFMDADYARNE